MNSSFITSRPDMPSSASSPFDTPIWPIHLPRNVEYNEVLLGFFCTLEMF